MPAAARIGDSHVCAYHRGGEILTGCPTVLFAERLAARVTDVAACRGPEEDSIVAGCGTVFIGGQQAARRLDATDGGHVTSGEPTVQIGPRSSPLAAKSAARALRRKRAR
jgi:uncharacterized Zn-binding protein involved in type VI secretion